MQMTIGLVTYAETKVTHNFALIELIQNVKKS